MAASDRKRIAVLGGAGKEGGGLALRWAHSGHSIRRHKVPDAGIRITGITATEATSSHRAAQ